MIGESIIDKLHSNIWYIIFKQIFFVFSNCNIKIYIMTKNMTQKHTITEGGIDVDIDCGDDVVVDSVVAGVVVCVGFGVSVESVFSVGVGSVVAVVVGSVFSVEIVVAVSEGTYTGKPIHVPKQIHIIITKIKFIFKHFYNQLKAHYFIFSIL